MEKLHVLIVEDDKDSANFFGVVLGMVGFECTIVHSARQALAQLASTQPDMILLDMRLGSELGGEDILYQIRSNPRLEQTRVIVITAYPSMAEPVTNLADLILLKPVDVEQLKTLTSRLMLRGDTPKYFHFRDPVTDYFNREFFLTRLDLAFERSRRRPDFMFALMVFAVAFLPAATGDLPEEVGDLALRAVADRLKRCYRPTDTLARLEGNQFLTLHEDLKQSGDLGVIVGRLQENLSRPVLVQEVEFPIQYAIGAVLFNSRYPNPESFLEAGMRALQHAQQEGENQIYLLD